MHQRQFQHHPSRFPRQYTLAAVMGTVGLALTTFNAHSQSELFDLTLDELLNVQVIVASDRLEDERSVFGSVDRVAESEWQRFGTKRPFDALQNVSGIDSHLSIGGTTTLSIRGYANATGSARGKALLYDGIPLNGFAFATDLYSKSLLSSQMLQSIEIVKGPISSFYGPDAFHGAILLRPWLSDYETRQTQIAIGTQDDYEANFRARYDLGNGIHATTNIGYFMQGPAGPFAPTAGRKYDFDIESKSLSQTFEYGQHRIGILLNESSTEDFYDVFQSDGYSKADPTTSTLLYYKSTLDLENGTTFKPSLWRNESTFELDFFADTRTQTWKDLSHGIKLHLEHETGDRLLKVGIEYIDMWITDSKSFSGSGYTFAPYNGFSREISTLFASYTNTYLEERLDINFGLRYDHFSNTKANEISPKLGMIFHVNEQNVLKLISASGYRAPAAGEIAGTTAFLGGSSLEGERLKSYEFIHIYNNEKFTLNNTIFINEWDDAITTQETAASLAAGLSAEFVNAGQNESYGYELEATFLAEDINTLAFLNASIIRSKNLDTGQRFTLFPETKLAAGIRYEGDQWDLSVTSLHKLDRTSSPLPEAQRLPDYHSLNLGIRYKSDTYSIDLNIDNLLDRTNIEPSIWSIPGGIYQTGAQARISVRTEF